MRRWFTVWTVAVCCVGASTGANAQVPGMIHYQGRVSVGGTNYDGTGQFRFALVNGGTNASRQAAALAFIASDLVVSNRVTDGGAGYATAPNVVYQGGGGSGATAAALVGGGAVTSVVRVLPGSGYTSPPAVVIDPPPVAMGYRTYWSNGTDGLSVSVSRGLYGVLLGDTSVPNMAALPASVFTNTDVRLRVWFNDGSGWQQLQPDPRIAAVGYALQAESARTAQGVVTGGISGAMIANGAVGAAQLASGAVTAAAIAGGAVGAAQLAAGAVTTVAIATGAVSSAAIADGAVGAAELGSNAVTMAALADGAVTAAKMVQVADVVFRAASTNPAGMSGDMSGFAVAGVGSNLIAVGTPYGYAGATRGGSVQLYTLNGACTTTITNPASAINDQFGSAVAGLGANRIIVGTPYDDAGATDAGSVYVFDANGGLLATVTNPTPARDDNFGWAVAGLGTNRVVIGAPYDDTGVAHAGCAYVYVLGSAALTTITNPAPGSDGFGYAVAAVGTNRIAIGAPFKTVGVAGAGAVYLHNLGGGAPVVIPNPAPSMSAFFGLAVAAAGTNRIVIGAPGDDAGAADAGSVYVYDLGGTLKTTIRPPLPAAGDGFGSSVAVVGSNVVAVGTYLRDAGAADAGTVYLFDLGGAWLATVANPAPQANDCFGYAVAGAGSNRLVVGAPNDDAGATDTGRAYLYELPGGWHADGVIAEGVQPGASFAGDGAALANLDAGNVASGTLADARLSGNLQALAANNGAALTNLDATDITGGTLADARLSAPLRALALNNGAALTNLNASALASGTLANARLDTPLQALALNNGSALTNLNASAIASGTLANARLDADLQSVAANNGSALTNLNAANLASGILSNSRLNTDLQKVAVNNGAALTNLNASALASGTLANARLDTDLQNVAVNNGAALTNLNAANLASGTLANLRLDADLQSLAVNNGAALTNLNASALASGTLANLRLDADLQNVAVNNGAALTNLNAANLASGILSNSRLDTDLQKVAVNNGAALTNLSASALASGTLANARLDADLQSVAVNNGAALTNLTLTGVAGAGLWDSNTLFISSTAPAGGNGSMARPWNSVLALTNNLSGRLNNKTVLLLAGRYPLGSTITFAAPCSNLTVKGLDRQNVIIVLTNAPYHIFSCATNAHGVVFEGLTLTGANNTSVSHAIGIVAGCTVRDCIFEAPSGTQGGGGVWCNRGGTVRDCLFRGCDFTSGAGVRCYEGGVVQNCTFEGCSADYGGGVACEDGGTVQDCTFTGCVATEAGGGVYCWYGGTVRNCVFIDCTADLGGGVLFAELGTIENSSFEGCSATSYGGGIYCDNGGDARSCSFTLCSAGTSGGGVYCLKGGSVRDSLFTACTATSASGGVRCNGGGTVQNCSIIRSGGTVNSVGSINGGSKWMSVWTNSTSAAGFVLWASDLDN